MRIKYKKIKCIYLIENIINNKKYIGTTSNFKKRKIFHFASLKAGTHPNKHLQSAFNKYKKENFRISILEEIEDDLFRYNREKELIESYNTYDNNYGYNKSKGGEFPATGFKHTSEFKLNSSISRGGKPFVLLSPEYKFFKEQSLKTFCKEHDLRPSGIRSILKKRAKRYHWWYGWYEDEFDKLYESFKTKMVEVENNIKDFNYGYVLKNKYSKQPPTLILGKHGIYRTDNLTKFLINNNYSESIWTNVYKSRMFFNDDNVESDNKIFCFEQDYQKISENRKFYIFYLLDIIERDN